MSAEQYESMLRDLMETLDGQSGAWVVAPANSMWKVALGKVRDLRAQAKRDADRIKELEEGLRVLEAGFSVLNYPNPTEWEEWRSHSRKRIRSLLAPTSAERTKDEPQT